MPVKINAYVCDGCRVCCGRKADGYPIENGWSFVTGEIRIQIYCPKCAPIVNGAQRFKEEGAKNEMGNAKA